MQVTMMQHINHINRTLKENCPKPLNSFINFLKQDTSLCPASSQKIKWDGKEAIKREN